VRRTDDLSSLLEALRADQRQRWQSGERVAVEDYLQQHRRVHDDVEGILELVYHEIVLREKHGESPLLAEYQQRFPRIAPQLEALFEVHRVIASVHSPVDSTLEKRAASESLSTADAGSIQIPGYEILRELGCGGMGRVYLARQTRLNRLVALKMILAGDPGPEEVSRFRSEAETVARLQHPNIVQIYEVGDIGGRPYLALEFVAGGSLARKLDGAPLPPRQAVELTAQLARAVEYAHQQGVIHRDLKPANILLQKSEVRSQRSEIGSQKSEDGLHNPSYLCPLTSDL
jgi:serine/threonine-protein kinase